VLELVLELALELALELVLEVALELALELVLEAALELVLESAPELVLELAPLVLGLALGEPALERGPALVRSVSGCGQSNHQGTRNTALSTWLPTVDTWHRENWTSPGTRNLSPHRDRNLGKCLVHCCQ